MWQLLLTSLAFTNILGQAVNFEAARNVTWNYGFEVNYANDEFLLDGKPFRYVSGSFHYFRAPRQYWRDRLRKMRAAGLNAVSTYVEWSLHQPELETWNWSGDADVLEFLNIAQQEDLLVLLRPGPYICAERDFGGLPYWLLKFVPDIRLRTNDRRYMTYVQTYLDEILTKVKPYLRGNGGPIIMVQVENEYGSYRACDTEYMNRLQEIFHQHIGNKALLYTTDGAMDSMLRCGYVPGAYTTVDFGTKVDVAKNFELMRLYQPRGPLVNSEFYPGWLTHWNEKFQRVKTEAVASTLDTMLSMNASVNIYMFYGGTNFGFTSGANGGEGAFSPQLTSYDYDAPLTEAGDPTDKYFAIRNIIGKYLPLPNITLPKISPKGDYGSVLFESIIELFDPQARELFGGDPIRSLDPMSFEALGFSHWLILYETDLPRVRADPAVLYAQVRDRAQVYIDNSLAGILSRSYPIYSMPLQNPDATNLKMLVENQGRLNYGNDFTDFKGIYNVTLNGVRLRSWNMTGFRIQSPMSLDQITDSISLTGTLDYGPVFLRGNFTIFDEPLDTYLDTTGWGKGIAFVNGYNLGRYWPLIGPQITLYVPAVYLQKGINELILLELEYVPKMRKMKFQDYPNLGGVPSKFKRNSIA